MKDLDDKNLLWSGDYFDKIDEVPGVLCSKIKSDVHLVTKNDNEANVSNFPLTEIESIKEYLNHIIKQDSNIKVPSIKLKSTNETKLRNILQFINNDQATKKTDKLNCKICQKMVTKLNMWQHIGKHIVKKESVLTWTENIHRCGFCGIDCQNQVGIYYKGSVINGTPQVLVILLLE